MGTLYNCRDSHHVETELTIYDRTAWHSGAERFPVDLPPEVAGTHIGMFLAWAILRDRVSEALRERSPSELLAVRRRRLTGRDFLFGVRNGELETGDLSTEGDAFAGVYYQDGQGMIHRNGYLADYERTLGGDLPDLYRVADTWENCDRIARVLDRRFEEWQSGRGLFAPAGGGNNFWRIVGGGP